LPYIYNYYKYIVKRLISYPLMHTVEERKFLYTLCSNALGMDESIVFTGVVNDCGKLIVGVPRLFVDQKNGPEGDSLFKSPPDSLCIFFLKTMGYTLSKL
jgi:hypothetical protein